jgi:hypothetical protein
VLRGQLLQYVPLEDAYSPAAHAVHVRLSDVMPAAHGTHDEASAEGTRPDAHVTQEGGMALPYVL